MSNKSKEKILGWREWISLPSLGVSQLKAKIDTGAKSSALHAWYVEPFSKNGENWVKFGLHPIQGDSETSIDCEARIADQRVVTDSGGHSEDRFVIETEIVMGDQVFETDMTLTNRDSMRFRMLVGRNTLNERFLVAPEKSFLLGLPEGQESTGDADEDSNTFEE